MIFMITIVVFIVILFIIAFLVYKSNRNEEVAKFRNTLIDMEYEYHRREPNSIHLEIYRSLPSYTDMYNGFKPLTLEKYLTYDQILKLDPTYKYKKLKRLIDEL